MVLNEINKENFIYYYHGYFCYYYFYYLGRVLLSLLYYHNEIRRKPIYRCLLIYLLSKSHFIGEKQVKAISQ